MKIDLLDRIPTIPLLGLCIAAFLLFVLVVLTVRGGSRGGPRNRDDQTPPRQL